MYCILQNDPKCPGIEFTERLNFHADHTLQWQTLVILFCWYCIMVCCLVIFLWTILPSAGKFTKSCVYIAMFRIDVDVVQLVVEREVKCNFRTTMNNRWSFDKGWNVVTPVKTRGVLYHLMRTFYLYHKCKEHVKLFPWCKMCARWDMCWR